MCVFTVTYMKKWTDRTKLPVYHINFEVLNGKEFVQTDVMQIECSLDNFAQAQQVYAHGLT
jgi:hypothetical protein